MLAGALVARMRIGIVLVLFARTLAIRVVLVRILHIVIRLSRVRWAIVVNGLAAGRVHRVWRPIALDVRCLSRRYAVAAELTRPVRGRNFGPPVIHRRQECVILASQMFVLELESRWCDVMFTRRGLLHRSRANGNTARSTVVADIV